MAYYKVSPSLKPVSKLNLKIRAIEFLHHAIIKIIFHKYKGFIMTTKCQSKEYSKRRSVFFVILTIVFTAMILCSSCSQKRNHDKIAKDYNRATKLKPKEASAYYNRGIAWLAKGNFDKAINDFNMVIELNPNDINAYYKRGVAWGAKGDNDRAIKDFNKVVELNPKNINAYYDRGVIWQSKGDLDKAIKDYNKVVELDPQNVYAYRYRGTAYAIKKDFEKALKDYMRAIELNPNDVYVYYSRGLIWDFMGDSDKAIKDFNKVIELDPQYLHAYFLRGKNWKKKGDFGKAINDIDQAIKLDPQNAEAYNSIAWIYATCPVSKYRNGKYAIQYAKKAVELEENHITLDTLAAAYAQNGKFDKAIETQQKAIDLIENKDAINRYKNRLDLYEKNKSYHAQ